MPINIIDLDRRAVESSITLVRSARSGDLSRPTPCAGWDLEQLLAHMSLQHRGFAAAAAGRGADPGVWAAGAPALDPVADYLAAAGSVLAAFAAPGVLETRFELPEIQSGGSFPAGQAISFHFIDYVVHGWDVARSLGLGYELEPAVTEAALAVAQAVPTGAAREVPGAAFAPVRTGSEDSGGIDRIVAILGRSPAWPD